MDPSKCAYQCNIEMLFVHFAVCQIVYSVPLRMLETGQKRAVKNPGQPLWKRLNTPKSKKNPTRKDSTPFSEHLQRFRGAWLWITHIAAAQPEFQFPERPEGLGGFLWVLGVGDG